ncbi:MAG TPA: outer membrane lipoprotein carrier protein LolA [Desulfuromonadales bacterium]|nr:outer membrane lipoprotein carrier protein LolA [Desulfuromonadales bacterium]
MNRIVLLVLVLVAFFPLPQMVSAKEDVSLQDVIQTLEGPFKANSATPSAIADFQADFLQESRVASLDRVQKGHGRVTVKFDRTRSDRVSRPLFRWEYDQPTRQEIVSNGKTMWVYVPENHQVIQSDIEASAQPRADDPLAFLTGLGNLSRDFQIAWASPNRDEQGNPVLELRPRQPSAVLQKLLVVVAKDAVAEATRRGKPGSIFPILSTTVYDPSDNSTRIEFSGVRVNRRLPDSHFNFVPPKGVEVVRPTGQGVGF